MTAPLALCLFLLMASGAQAFVHQDGISSSSSFFRLRSSLARRRQSSALTEEDERATAATDEAAVLNQERFLSDMDTSLDALQQDGITKQKEMDKQYERFFAKLARHAAALNLKYSQEIEAIRSPALAAAYQTKGLTGPTQALATLGMLLMGGIMLVNTNVFVLEFPTTSSVDAVAGILSNVKNQAANALASFEVNEIVSDFQLEANEASMEVNGLVSDLNDKASLALASVDVNEILSDLKDKANEASIQVNGIVSDLKDNAYIALASVDLNGVVSRMNGIASDFTDKAINTLASLETNGGVLSDLQDKVDGIVEPIVQNGQHVVGGIISKVQDNTNVVRPSVQLPIGEDVITNNNDLVVSKVMDKAHAAFSTTNSFAMEPNGNIFSTTPTTASLSSSSYQLKDFASLDLYGSSADVESWFTH